MSINITISGELIVTHEKDISYNDPGATATDGSNNYIVDISFNNLNINKVGSYQIIYKATDNKTRSKLKRGMIILASLLFSLIFFL